MHYGSAGRRQNRSSFLKNEENYSKQEERTTMGMKLKIHSLLNSKRKLVTNFNNFLEYD